MNDTGNRRPARIAINGFGRIGRTLMRLALLQPEIEVVAINDLADPETIAHQLRYDSTHGPFTGTILLHEDQLDVDGRQIRLLREGHPGALPWAAEEIDIVVEATGRFTSRAAAAMHLQAGARYVLISAPSVDADRMVVLGVNEASLDLTRHRIISNASCTTNCLAPMLKVLNDSFGIRRAFMTTVHPYTNNQPLHDSPHSDLRRGRGGAQSMIPTTTTAIQAVIQVMPELKGRIDGMAVRVPTGAVANIDLVAELVREVDPATVNLAFVQAAGGGLKNILAITEEPLVSIDFQGSRYSAAVDASCTQVVGGNLVRVLAWYDNESGYSSRLLDLIKLISSLGSL